MEISVKTDIKQATRWLNSTQRKQIPFAVAGALTDTAFDARKAIQVQLPRKLKAPTPWTIRGVRVMKATKRKLLARVYFNDDRAKYMQYQIAGGTRLPYGRAIPMPKNVNLNKYGNLGRNKINRLLARPDTFMGTVKGVPGIWQRGHVSKAGKFSARNKGRSSNIRLLIRFEDKATYQPKFPMHKIVAGVTRSRFKRNFSRRLAHALRTAR